MNVRAWELLKHPITGLVIGILGISAAFLTYFWSKAEKQPLYAVSLVEPIAKTSVQAPRLTILWNGSPVPNVMSAKIAIWNAGSQFIDAKDISHANPIRFVPSAKVKILAADLVRSSRSNLKFQASIENDLTLGTETVVVSILGDDALENRDGGLFQILFAGDNDIDFTVAGRIKGAPEGFKRKEWKSIARLVRYNKWSMVLEGIIFIMGILLVGMGLTRVALGEKAGWAWVVMGGYVVVTAVLRFWNPSELPWVST